MFSYIRLNSKRFSQTLPKYNTVLMHKVHKVYKNADTENVICKNVICENVIRELLDGDLDKEEIKERIEKENKK